MRNRSHFCEYRPIVNRVFATLFAFAVGFAVTQPAAAVPIDLGTAGGFAVLAGTTVTNTGPTVINGGNVGVSPGTALTGFASVSGTFTTHSANGVALQAQKDLTTAYNTAAGLTHTQDLTGFDLGGRVLVPGTYFFSSSAQLTGKLTLDTLGNPDAQFVFQIGSTLTTASDASVVSLSGLDPLCAVFWQVGSSATLGTNTKFQGHIMALTSITLNTGATIVAGSALARNGAVTLDRNTINNSMCDVTNVPDAGASTLVLALGALFLLGAAKRAPVTKPALDS